MPRHLYKHLQAAAYEVCHSNNQCRTTTSDITTLRLTTTAVATHTSRTKSKRLRSKHPASRTVLQYPWTISSPTAVGCVSIPCATLLPRNATRHNVRSKLASDSYNPAESSFTPVTPAVTESCHCWAVTPADAATATAAGTAAPLPSLPRCPPSHLRPPRNHHPSRRAILWAVVAWRRRGAYPHAGTVLRARVGGRRRRARPHAGAVLRADVLARRVNGGAWRRRRPRVQRRGHVRSRGVRGTGTQASGAARVPACRGGVVGARGAVLRGCGAVLGGSRGVLRACRGVAGAGGGVGGVRGGGGVACAVFGG